MAIRSFLRRLFSSPAARWVVIDRTGRPLCEPLPREEAEAYAKRCRDDVDYPEDIEVVRAGGGK
jgi:hypothetical protein